MNLESSSRARLPTAALAWLARAGRPGRELAPWCDCLRDVGWDVFRQQQRAEARAAGWTSAARRRVYREIWQDAAERNSAQLESLPGDFFRIRKGEWETLVWYHTVMFDYGVSLLLALDKVAVHRLLQEAGVPTAAHVRCDVWDRRTALDFLDTLGGAPCVVKPAASTSGGEGVTCGVHTPDELERARIWAQRWDRRLLIEQQAFGKEYRLLFLDGELLDVLRRDPPAVVGDGRSSVGALIDAENRRRADSGGRLGTSFLRVDLDCLLHLEREGLTLRSVPADGEVITVKVAANENGASGNMTVDPAEVSPALIADAARAARACTLRFAGVEVITPDAGAPLSEAGGLVVEVNGTPGLHYHYLVADPSGATRVAVPLLAALLDPSRGGGYRPLS